MVGNKPQQLPSAVKNKKGTNNQSIGSLLHSVIGEKQSEVSQDYFQAHLVVSALDLAVQVLPSTSDLKLLRAFSG